jgi:glycosyltransferase involved in cell wall biosynthesis
MSRAHSASPAGPPRDRPGRAAIGRLAAWALVAAQAGLGWRAARNYARWPALRPPAGATLTPPVAIIVPARDEAANLARLLPSLRALRPAPREIVVVDDRSRDATAALARAHGVRVVAGVEPPPGWTGKCWACQEGRAATVAPWLLFTDADTDHAPSSLGAALAACQRASADALSLLTDQECRTFWERLLLPFAYAGYFTAASARWANQAPRRPTPGPSDSRDRPSRPPRGRTQRPPGFVPRERGAVGGPARAALANGQYILVRAAAYDAAGGHAAVRGSLTEDVALAARLRASGARLRVLRAGGLVRVRMYTGLPAIWTGFRKNSFGFLRAHPAHGVIVVAATLLAGLPLGLSLAAARGHVPWAAAIGSYGVGLVAYLPWLRWFGVPARYAPLQPLAYLVFQAIALDSAARTLLGLPIGWKGRQYRP